MDKFVQSEIHSITKVQEPLNSTIYSMVYKDAIHITSLGAITQLHINTEVKNGAWYYATTNNVTATTMCCKSAVSGIQIKAFV